jgi:hypothetical protein
MPAEMGPFIGEVKNNVDPTRSGRLQVFIEQFSNGASPDDSSLWRTVSYVPPFYGVTPHAGTNIGTGTYLGNQQSYGFWFTPPDIGVKVICFFVNGDPSQGYYIGCVPDAGINHMIPAIGSSSNFQPDNSAQADYFAQSLQLPVTEINSLNIGVSESPRFFDQSKPIHSVVATVMLQQGLINDPIRGPITSSSQRESPSSVFGFSTPGRAIYQGGFGDANILQELQTAKPENLKVIGRRGGHSIVLDDGDLTGQDNLVRIRTAKGHQITMSDNGDCFYITHANGQTWLEFGSEGTVDVFATNSVNVRTQGTINFHADQDINLYAGNSINLKSQNIKQQAVDRFTLISENDMSIYSNLSLGVKSDGTLNMQSKSGGGWNGGSSLVFKGDSIDLNGPTPAAVTKPKFFKDFALPDVVFETNVGWVEETGAIKTIVTRAPTHEPYPYHNRGTDIEVSL